MKTKEAIAECERWFARNRKIEAQSKELQKLAADRRAGRCDEITGKRRRDAIMDPGLTVYDASELEAAVKHLVSIAESI